MPRRVTTTMKRAPERRPADAMPALAGEPWCAALRDALALACAVAGAWAGVVLRIGGEALDPLASHGDAAPLLADADHLRAALKALTRMPASPVAVPLTGSRDGSVPGEALALRLCRGERGIDAVMILSVPAGRATAGAPETGELLARAARLAEGALELQGMRTALGETRSLFGAIIESLPIGVFLKDMEENGRYLMYNAAVSDLVGRDPGMVIGRCDHDVFGPELGACFIREDRAVMRSGEQMAIPAQAITRATGEPLWIRVIKKPLATAPDAPARYLLGIAEDITGQRRSAERLAHMAQHDALTGLPNRILFRERLESALARDGDAGRVAVLSLDLDLFKAVNDTFGHQAGDLLLVEVAARLRSTLAAGEVLARLGGDEFAVLTAADTDADALGRAARLRACLEESFDLGECSAQVDVSIGIVTAGSSASSGETIMRYADMALYQAKAQGRGVAHLYTPTLSDAVERRHAMTQDLRLALKRQEFMLVYQPLYNMEAGRISGFEALLRWQHPERGLIAPAEFIPLAEQTGLIIPIGEWVLQQACREVTHWPAEMRVAVNLSPIQFRTTALVPMIEQALQQAGVPPSRLELEVTESVLLTGASNVDVLRRLRAMGIRIAIDDFGTGYSSLSYLRTFPFDKIKMDRSFVADVCDNAESLAIVRAVTGLGSSLSITTTAEGIETAEQFARLEAEGFNEVQGYWIGRPMSASQARVMAQTRLPAGSLALDCAQGLGTRVRNKAVA